MSAAATVAADALRAAVIAAERCAGRAMLTSATAETAATAARAREYADHAADSAQWAAEWVDVALVWAAELEVDDAADWVGRAFTAGTNAADAATRAHAAVGEPG